MTCSRLKPFLKGFDVRQGIAAFLKSGVFVSASGWIASAPLAGAQDADADDQAVVYTLVSVNGHELPTTVIHGETKIRVRSGTFTIKGDGTCTSEVEFEMPSNAVVTRDVRAKYVREGSRLQMQWEGAGKTVGIISGDNFTMDNEGMQFAYTSLSAKTKQKALDRFIGKWRSLTPQRGPADMTSEVQLTYRRILGGKYVEEEGVGVDGSTAKLIYTYDAIAQRYRLWGFRSSMPPTEATGTWNPTTRTFTWTSVPNDRQQLTTIATHRFLDDNSFEWDAQGKDAAGKIVWRVDGKANRISESNE